MKDSTNNPPVAVPVARSVWRYVGLTAVAAMMLGGVAAWRVTASSDRKPNVLLISIDTLRADHLGAYGYRQGSTPFLDHMALSGAVFEQAMTVAPITLPSHASLLTGLTPPHHGARDNDTHRLPPKIPTLAGVLRRAGYQTGGFVSGPPLKRLSGIARGFDHFNDDVDTATSAKNQAHRSERFAQETLDAALTWIKGADPARPVFTFVHLFDPHGPYELPLPGSAEPSYDGDVAYADRALGEFTRALKQVPGWEDALIVITSDHGESLGDHKELSHTIFVYQATMHIPMIVVQDGVIPRTRVELPVSIVDLFPTILELTGTAVTENVDGVSLVGLINGDEPATSRALYFESLYGELRFGWASLRGVRAGKYKYIEAPRPELYDLSTDPNELSNIVAKNPQKAQELAAVIGGIDRGLEAYYGASEQDRVKMAELGYLSAPPVNVDPDQPPIDPKDGIYVYHRMAAAHDAMRSKRVDDAMQLMAGIEGDFKNSSYFYFEWGNMAVSAKQYDLAEKCYHNAIRLQPSMLTARRNLGVQLLMCKRPLEAAQAFEGLLALDGDHADAHLYLGLLYSRELNNPTKMVRHWKRFLELSPSHPDAAEIRRALIHFTSKNPGVGADAEQS